MKDSFKIKNYWLERQGDSATKLESWEESKWTIHEGDTWYLLSGPKLMSSWAHGAHRRFCEIYFKTSDLTISDISTNETMLSQHSEFTQSEAEKFAERVREDWEKMRNGLEPSKTFVFVMRNPTQKFLSGLIQDTISNFYEDPFNNHFGNPKNKEFKEDFNRLMFEKGHSLDLIEEFMNSEIHIDSWTLDRKFLKIYKDALMIPVEWYFDIQTPQWRTHMNMDMFILHKMIFHSQHSKNRNFNNQKIRIVDMDKECVGTVLNKLSGIEKKYDYNRLPDGGEYGDRDRIHDDDDKHDVFNPEHGKPGIAQDYNIRGQLMKYLVFEGIFENEDYLAKIAFLISGREYCWFELMNKIYPWHMYDKALGIEKKPFSAYKDKYGITDWENFRNRGREPEDYIKVDMYDAYTYTHFYNFFYGDVERFLK